MNRNVLAVATVSALFAVSAQAAQIDGELNFNGPQVSILDRAGNVVTDLRSGYRLDFSPNHPNLNMQSFYGSGTLGTAFPYAGGLSAGGIGSIQDLTYRGFSGSIDNFFTLSGNGNTLEFDLEDLNYRTSTLENGQGLTISGVGTLALTGYDATPGTWTFTTQMTGGQASASTSTRSKHGAVGCQHEPNGFLLSVPLHLSKQCK